MRKRERGFTLVEIMIVVAIIALLAAIAIPNFLRARHNANEAAAIGACRTISSACESFRAVQVTPGYPATLGALSGATPPYIDTVLSSGTKQGYSFTYVSGVNTFTLNASPTTYKTTGTRGFFVDESGVVRQDADGTAAVGDTPIQ